MNESNFRRNNYADSNSAGKPYFHSSLEKDDMIKPTVCRTITVDRNKTGYGFTLSRYVICSDDQKVLVKF
jgi:hypothetical protein